MSGSYDTSFIYGRLWDLGPIPKRKPRRARMLPHSQFVRGGRADVLGFTALWALFPLFLSARQVLREQDKPPLICPLLLQGGER